MRRCGIAGVARHAAVVARDEFGVGHSVSLPARGARGVDFGQSTTSITNPPRSFTVLLRRARWGRRDLLRGAWGLERRSARRRRRRPNRPRAAPFSGDRLLSTACEAIFFRLAAQASLASRRRPIKGLNSLSPWSQAFPRISKFFQGNSKEIPSFSKLFQRFPNFFLGRFEGNQGVVGQSSRNRVFSKILRGLGRGRAARR